MSDHTCFHWRNCTHYSLRRLHWQCLHIGLHVNSKTVTASFRVGWWRKIYHYTVECRKWENPATNKAFKKSLNNHTVSRLHDNHLFSCQKWRVIISRMFQLYSEAHFMTFLKRPSLISKVLPLSLKSVLKLSCLED